jgi:hypothetical protein
MPSTAKSDVKDWFKRKLKRKKSRPPVLTGGRQNRPATVRTRVPIAPAAVGAVHRSADPPFSTIPIA